MAEILQTGVDRWMSCKNALLRFGKKQTSEGHETFDYGCDEIHILERNQIYNPDLVSDYPDIRKFSGIGIKGVNISESGHDSDVRVKVDKDRWCANCPFYEPRKA